MTDLYHGTNAIWPSEIPECSRIEAERAALRLYRHFGSPRISVRVRRCWITSSPCNEIRRGWRRLVHDMSHRIRGRHSGWHARLEGEMARYIIEQGWLDGKLKPKLRPEAPVDMKAVRSARVEASIARWQSKIKRAETALRKLRRQRSYYDRIKEKHECCA